MTYKFEDFADGDSKKEIRVPCPLGDKCDHEDVAACDAYRQSLMEEEHRKNCGPDCTHFGNPGKGVPNHARFQGLSPAEYLLKSRGL